MPLRLEYRVVQTGKPLVRAHATLETVATDRRAAPGTSPLRFRTERPRRQEIWFRWYPDDPFASETPPPPSAREQTLLQRFRAAVAASGAAWHDASNAAVAEAWQRFAGDIGAYRALALMRGSVPDTPDDSAGLLLALPDTVRLYALRGMQLTAIGGGTRIAAGLRYTPRALRAGDWLTDFDQAVTAGMGVRISDPDAVKAALGADWIVVVGVRAGDRSDELEAHLRKAVIAGEFEIVPQDSPTNNAPGRPTGYRYDPRDTLDVLRRSTWLERRGATAVATDADSLAEALGINADVAYAAPNAAERDLEHAADMAAALVPGLVGTTFQWLPPEVATEADVVDLLVSCASARGPLPVVRLGRNPYGVLPLAIPEGLEAPATEPPARSRAFEAIRALANTAVGANLAHAGAVPVIRPGDADVGERLAAILRRLPVSCRLDIGGVGDRAKTPKRLGCPLVESNEWRPAAYLPALLDAPPDAGAREAARAQGAPLLWHLVELSWEAVQRELPQALQTSSPRQLVSGAAGAALPAATLARLRRFHDGVGRLAGVDRRTLEVLVFEVIDLLDYRADAWLTALATCRLRSQRAAGVGATELGYYGFLGRLRPEAVTGASGGYVQAPSMAQAASAGLLRAAARRHGDAGPFAVRLTSTRVRSALRLLAGLRQGVPLTDQLGYQAERLLHERNADVLIGAARSLFPLSQGTGADGAQVRLCDGLDFAKAADSRFASLPNAQRSVMRQVRDVLADALDALSDVLVAEAVHQLSLGNTGAAQAWMQVLSGEPVPAALSFLGTRREGQATQYRVACVFEPGTAQGSNPRVYGEPTLAALAAKLLPELSAGVVRVRVPRADGTPHELEFSLVADLGMDAVDLVLGGEREVILRARQLLVRRWRKTAGLRAELGPMPSSGLNEFLHQDRPVAVVLTHGSPSVEVLLARAKGCARVVSNARALDATDLNAAAGPELALDEANRAAHAAVGIEALEARRKALLAAAEGALAALDESIADAEARSLEIRRRLAAGDSRETLAALLAGLDDARDALDDALVQASRFSLPDALLPFVTDELVDAADGWFSAFRRIRKALAEKRARLEAADSVVSVQSSLRSRETVLRTLRDAIRYAIDGEGFPVWPPFRQTAATAPGLDVAAGAAAAVGPWAQLRPALRAAVALAGASALRAWKTRARATVRADDPDPTEGRPEEERPLNEYAAVYLDQAAGPLDRQPDGQRMLAGFVADEWSALRPSRMQGTALAVHYDAPQSEPPHVLLLGVAERAAHTKWSADDAAALVRETIRLMQVRALPARVASLRQSVGQLFNVIPPDGGRGRIPTRTRPLVVRPDGMVPVTVVAADAPSPQRKGSTLLDRES